jgi:hypothetical protein
VRSWILLSVAILDAERHWFVRGWNVLQWSLYYTADLPCWSVVRRSNLVSQWQWTLPDWIFLPGWFSEFDHV